MLEPLTYKQARILYAIYDWSAGCLATPTMREIAERAGRSVTTVYETVGILRRKGWLMNCRLICLTEAAYEICHKKVEQKPESYVEDESAIDRIVEASNVAN